VRLRSRGCHTKARKGFKAPSGMQFLQKTFPGHHDIPEYKKINII
jgi:hypothetical protein